MQFTTSVSQKGQATIPAQIRQKLGITTNSKVIFELKSNNEATIKPVADFFSLKGSIKTTKPFDIKAMDKETEKLVVREYGQKPNRY